MPLVTLSDGAACKVRQLGLFELDGKGREVLGPYRYTLLLASGQFVEAEYDLRSLSSSPRPPDQPIEQIKPGTTEWYALTEYETYLAALEHERRRIESYHGYVADIVAYILKNCVGPEDQNRIVTPEDWDKIYQAAIVPELTLEVIADTLRNTFQGYIWWTGNPGRAFEHLQK